MKTDWICAPSVRGGWTVIDAKGSIVIEGITEQQAKRVTDMANIKERLNHELVIRIDDVRYHDYDTILSDPSSSPRIERVGQGRPPCLP